MVLCMGQLWSFLMIYVFCVWNIILTTSFIRWGNSCDSVWKVKQAVTWVHSDWPVWKWTEIVRPLPNSCVIMTLCGRYTSVGIIRHIIKMCLFSQWLYAYRQRLHLVYKKGQCADLPLLVKDFSRRRGTGWGQSQLLDRVIEYWM